ncbi:MAG: class I SAM-dependent methyltransferase [Ilumatobacteraceae bacterium]
MTTPTISHDDLDTGLDTGLDAGLDTYALGRSDAETTRLIRQHQLYGPITRQHLVAAGITRGMRVLDLGSGAGDVVLLLADLVGPEGRVIGVDINPAILATARARVAAAGWTNVDLIPGDIGAVDLDLDVEIDAVVGRWVLMYVERPAALLARVATLLRPGGIVAMLESLDLRDPVRAFPPSALHDRIAGLMQPPAGAPGPTMDMGLRLHRTFVDAGLAAPQLRVEAPAGGGPDWPGYGYVAETFRSLLPMLERVGAVQPGEVDIDTLEDRLRADAVGCGRIQILPTLVGAWSRRT